MATNNTNREKYDRKSLLEMVWCYLKMKYEDPITELISLELFSHPLMEHRDEDKGKASYTLIPLHIFLHNVHNSL